MLCVCTIFEQPSEHISKPYFCIFARVKLIFQSGSRWQLVLPGHDVLTKLVCMGGGEEAFMAHVTEY